ncbi:hypothetical protein FHS29_006848 [Saccharothrix tamanrassetensis]|uniref:Uncharacterized protein n=1 Tax=Saccharothrix tamanrassetensis TaxID=1051531 RepID=A0A841CW91_9PSEU|nr:hypothetical protein [Saccharothrix tamanrassetensis]MBB5960225.1 hypothetical protein [Saccharothrix tamanrassetensis]
MRKEAPVKGTGRGGAKGDAGAGTRLSRAQLLALIVGTLQIVVGMVPVFPLPPGHQTLHVCTGLAGLVLAWKHEHARLYGIALLLLYGKLLITDMDTSGGWLQLPTLETVAYGRTALAGLVIAFVPAFSRR